MRCLLFFYFLITPLLYSYEQIQPYCGNFALSYTQRPSPLVSFGQFLTDEGALELFVYSDGYLGQSYFWVDAIPVILYGLTEYASIYAEIPFLIKGREGNQRASGIEDINLFYEFSFLEEETKRTYTQATIVLGMTIPTGNAEKNPILGYGTPAFFAGVTYNYSTIWWEVFVSPGALFTTQRGGIKFGDVYLYQWGFEVVFSATQRVMWAGYLEFDGSYERKDCYYGSYNPNSGGNVLILTPSLYYANRKSFFGAGISLPIFEHLNGIQPYTNVILRGYGGFTF